MFTTMFAAATLGAALTPAAVGVPSWQADYGTALTAAAAQKKPMAVFIGRGDAGYARVVGGTVPADASRLLAKDFVCLYVDTDTAAGKSLAGQFEMADGLVISGKGGDVQALRHAGAVAPADLTGYLTRYSHADAVVTTEKAGEGATAAAAAAAATMFGGCPNGRCGAVSPAMYGSTMTPTATPVYYPAGTYPSYYPGFSSCPNGRCPNAR